MNIDRQHLRWTVAGLLVLAVVTLAGIWSSEVQASRPEATALATQKFKQPIGAVLIMVKYEGRVTDPTGKSLPGVKVTLKGKKNYTAATDAKGVFRFQGVLPGTYTITLQDPSKQYTFPSGVKLYNLFQGTPSPK